MWNTEWGKGCVHMEEPHSAGGAEVLRRQLRLYLWGQPCRVTGLLLHTCPMYWVPISSCNTADDNSQCMSLNLVQEQSPSWTIRAPCTANPSPENGDKWRSPSKAISNMAIHTAIDVPCLSNEQTETLLGKCDTPAMTLFVPSSNHNISFQKRCASLVWL